jgi:hypothetical protein
MDANCKLRQQLSAKARVMVNQAIRNGRLPPASTLNCADCEKQATGYDHRDYRRPLDVEPVCQLCNHRRGPGLPLPGERIEALPKSNAGRPIKGLESKSRYQILMQPHLAEKLRKLGGNNLSRGIELAAENAKGD